MVATTKATELTVKGITDFRISQSNTSTSYIKGGYGKFRYSDGTTLSLAQAGLETDLQLTDSLSARVIANGYLDGEDNAIGITEAFLKYQGIPNQSGYRLSARAGIFYPHISLEHVATAWTTKDTLTASTLGTWLGEEIRVAGIESKLSRLGKFHNSSYDLSFTASLFKNNDPAGALLSWHGWTQSIRQTLWTEQRPFPTLHSPMLAEQAPSSDPFLELDGRWGYHLLSEVKKTRKGLLAIGYYNNRATPYIVKFGQYGWHTHFYHIGGKWRFDNNLELTWQYLNGTTLMQAPTRVDVVNNAYDSGYIMLSKRWQQHRLTARIEAFSVTDRDQTELDNNQEHGHGTTINYQYRLTKQWFLSAEYNWLKSYRPSRKYALLPLNVTENQLQLSARYFFKI